MNTNISIFSVKEKKTTKGQTYWSFDTSEGRINCFDSAIGGPAAEKGVGKLCEVSIMKDGKYTNLTGFHNVLGDAIKQEEDSGHYDAKMRRITDCVLAAHEAFTDDKIEKKEIFEHADALYQSILTIERTSHENSNVQQE